MAFNFNWSPLIADTARAKEMLTAALNKSPKPPIIVDDILVNELNLGTAPPELDILEIGDLAEDRFRGIFKLSYAGDAFVTLRTRVQANPLNTTLSTNPSFASPQPLAAASGLTIPLQITLSDIRLQGFVILVFCRQKGITLVFRNDPLESLKVSSTFDSIPFVRNYLQKEIEAQLRVLFMDDLPAIIHRLSLRHLVPGYREAEQQQERESLARLAHTPIDPIGGGDGFFTLDPSEMHATFSRKNMLRLAALAESQRTLSLFTAPVTDTVFRAWTAASDRRVPSLSAIASPTTGWSSAASNASEISGSRPALTAHTLSASVMPSHRNGGKKRRHRIVNLRRHSHDDAASVTTECTTTTTRSTSHLTPDRGWATGPTSPVTRAVNLADEVSTPPPRCRRTETDPDPTPKALSQSKPEPEPRPQLLGRSLSIATELSSSFGNLQGGILERAWIAKIQSDHLRRVEREKANRTKELWEVASDGRDELGPPPAYVV